MRGMTSPEALDRYRYPDRRGPGGQRCQLLVEHLTPAHIASLTRFCLNWWLAGDTQ